MKNQHLQTPVRLAVCLEADEYEGIDLFRGRLYQILPDDKAKNHGQLRVVDESGEDYLYPADWFVFVEVTEPVKQVLALL